MNKLFIAALAVAISGCTIVPFNTASKACNMLSIATDEADLAPHWYITAGEVLHACGSPGAKEEAERRACAANKRNGYECTPKATAKETP